MGELYIGLISGTSMDAIDAALVEFDDKAISPIAFYSHAIPASLRTDLLQLIQQPDQAGLDLVGETDIALGHQFAEAAMALLEKNSIRAEQVSAIGSHGQTIRHSPDTPSMFTMQIGNPNTIAFQTGITTVADFRSMDMAAGGQGAPLAPAFHNEVFRASDEDRGVLNIGGIANITYLPGESDTAITGFDTGPANTLLDAWILQSQQLPFDRDGAWSSTGRVNQALLNTLLADPYLRQAPPKSTGREHYNLSWLQQQLQKLPSITDADVQATLCRFSVETIADAIETWCPQISRVIACGGGVHNRHLMDELASRLNKIHVESSETYGVDPDWVEAIAFAWLAKQRMHGQTLALQSITGASRELFYGNLFASGAE